MCESLQESSGGNGAIIMISKASKLMKRCLIAQQGGKY